MSDIDLALSLYERIHEEMESKRLQNEEEEEEE